MPVDRIASATVIAERSADADAFAKVCNVLEPEDSVRMARSLPNVECLIVTKDGRTARRDGWHRYERLRPALLALAGDHQRSPSETPRGAGGPPNAGAAAPTVSWNPGELVVNFEINRPDAEAGRYRRPYVAVWVEDKGGASVRPRALVPMARRLFQWLPDLSAAGTRAIKTGAATRKSCSSRSRGRPARPASASHLGRQGRPGQAAPGRRVHRLC